MWATSEPIQQEPTPVIEPTPEQASVPTEVPGPVPEVEPQVPEPQPPVPEPVR